MSPRSLEYFGDPDDSPDAVSGAPKCSILRFWAGLHPRPHLGAHSSPPDPLAGFKGGGLFLRKERKREEGKRKRRVREEGEEREDQPQTTKQTSHMG